MELKECGPTIIEKLNASPVDSPGVESVNFADLAMQVLSVQKLATASKKEDPFLEKYTDISRTESVARLDGRTELSTDSNVNLTDNSLKDASFVSDPFGVWYLVWSLVVSIGVAYSYWTIILRLAFIEGQGKQLRILMILDYVMDLLFLLDMWVQSRTGYMENGQLVVEVRKTRRHYMHSIGFLVDCIAVLPLDLLYLRYEINPVFRIGRLVKLHRFVSFSKRMEIITNHYNLFNLCLLIHHVFLIIHWVAAVYFMVSKSMGYGSEPWVYPALQGEWAKITRQYLYCFYLSSVTMTIVGNVPTPQTPQTLSFVIVMYLAGILVFAMIVGSACDMITNMAIKRTEFHAKINEIKIYMFAHNVPENLQKRVVKWFDYLWMENIDLHDEDTIELLPEKYQAELLLHVNLDTLKKVAIFEDCEPSLLRELVIRLRPTQCCPGDYVCHQGEVGNEMYILNKGQLEVEVDEHVVATLAPGNHFGEISILNIEDVRNRRTASIRSVGFSQLFKLAKGDLQQVLEDYPNARYEMEAKAREVLKKDHERKRSFSPEESNGNIFSTTDWLTADCTTLRQQVLKVELQLKEKKMKSIKEKLREQQAQRNKQLVRSFVKKNFCNQNAQDFIRRFVATNQLSDTASEIQLPNHND